MASMVSNALSRPARAVGMRSWMLMVIVAPLLMLCAAAVIEMYSRIRNVEATPSSGD